MDGDLLLHTFENYRALLAGIIGRYVARELVEDLLQETFIDAWTHRESFRGESKPSSWLVRIAINRALNYLRQQGKKDRANCSLDEQTDEFAFDIPSPTPSQQTQVIRDEAHRQMVDAIGAVPKPRDRMIVFLRADGASVAEIGETMVMSIPAVKASLYRTKKRLLVSLARARRYRGGIDVGRHC